MNWRTEHYMCDYARNKQTKNVGKLGTEFSRMNFEWFLIVAPQAHLQVVAQIPGVGFWSVHRYLYSLDDARSEWFFSS